MYVAQADLKLATLPPQPPKSQVYRLHCLLYDVIMANDSMARVSPLLSSTLRPLKPLSPDTSHSALCRTPVAPCCLQTEEARLLDMAHTLV